MLNPVQEKIDCFLRSYDFRSIIDIQYFPDEATVLIVRDKRRGRANVLLDVGDLASPQEVLERVINHPAVDAERKKSGKFFVNYQYA